MPCAAVPSERSHTVIAVVRSRDLGIATCSHSGVTIPECCCTACLEDQIRRYRPAVLSRSASEHVPDELGSASGSEMVMSASPQIGLAEPEIALG